MYHVKWSHPCGRLNGILICPQDWQHVNLPSQPSSLSEFMKSHHNRFVSDLNKPICLVIVRWYPYDFCSILLPELFSDILGLWTPIRYNNINYAMSTEDVLINELSHSCSCQGWEHSSLHPSCCAFSCHHHTIWLCSFLQDADNINMPFQKHWSR